MLKLMRKLVLLLYFMPIISFSQTTNEEINSLLNDATLYAGKFVSPATEAVVYQASSAWMMSAKKRKTWDFTFAVNNNLFLVPKSNREMKISNADFENFYIEGTNPNDNSLVTVPTAFGDKSSVNLIGTITVNGTPQTFKTRVDGINQETVYYPYLQGALALPYGFEFLAKYSFKNKLKKGDFQVYGVGLQYNISQHFKKLTEKNWNIAALIAYNNENFNVDIFQSSGSTISLGIESMNSKINSFHAQINASKTFNKFEVMGGIVLNSSNIKYYFVGEPTLFDFSSLFNEKVKDLYKTQTMVFGEISGRYNFYKDFMLQTTFSFGSQFNTNFGIQYEFN